MKIPGSKLEIPVYKLDGRVTDDKDPHQDTYRSITLTQLWSGGESEADIGIQIGAQIGLLNDALRVSFSAPVAALSGYLSSSDLSAEHNAKYVEGLWEADVFELFIADKERALYQEFNLAPDGNWWSMGFCGVRKRIEAFKAPAGVKTAVRVKNGFWQGVLLVPLSSIFFLKDSEHSLIDTALNLTAIFYKDSPKFFSPRFFSVAELLGDEPDFHQPGAFLPLRLTE